MEFNDLDQEKMLTVIMNLCNQGCHYSYDKNDDKYYWNHRYLAAYVEAFEYLASIGMIKHHQDGNYEVIKWQLNQ